MKKSTKLIVRLLSLSLLCVCFWGNHANAKGWEDENILRQETVYGMDENERKIIYSSNTNWKFRRYDF